MESAKPAGNHLALCLVALAGCSPCGSEPQVEGPHPYVRCAMADVEEREVRVGEVELEIADRTILARGLTRFAVFAAGDAESMALDGLEDVPVFVMGGFARSEPEASAILERLGTRLSFLLPGGEDDPEVMDAVFDEDHLVDLRGVRSISLDGVDLIVLPGARDGRYALGEGSCGYSPEDLSELEDDVGAREEDDSPRVWLAWQSPSFEGPYAPDRGFAGVHVGDEALANLGTELGIEGGFFGWPGTQAGVVSRAGGAQLALAEAGFDLLIAAPRLGAWNERGDGAAVPSGVVQVELTDEGLRAAFAPL